MENDRANTRMQQLADDDGGPLAQVLTPEVRSGSSFSFPQNLAGTATRPACMVVWAFRVAPDKHTDFRNAENTFVSAGFPGVPAGVEYRGTYAVTVSAIAPDFEYRTYWGLADLSMLKALNDCLHGAGATLRAMLNLILPDPVMRAEIMGLVEPSKGIPEP